MGRAKKFEERVFRGASASQRREMRVCRRSVELAWLLFLASVDQGTRGMDGAAGDLERRGGAPAEPAGALSSASLWTGRKTVRAIAIFLGACV